MDILQELMAAGVTEAELETAAGVAAGLLGIYLVIGFISLLLTVIGQWKIYTKAGEAGWKALIPIYSGYTRYKISWNKFLYLASVALLVVFWFFAESTGFMSVVGIICGLAGSIIQFISMFKLSKSFGKGIGFAIGLIILNPIFTLILGVGKAQYVGVNGIPAENYDNY